MRRPRRHRLTGSVRRLLAAAVLAAVAAAAAVTMAAASGGVHGALVVDGRRCLPLLPCPSQSLLPTGLPTVPSSLPTLPSSLPTLPSSLPTLPTLPICPPVCLTTPPAPSTPIPSLPTSLPTPCLANCTPGPGNGGGGQSGGGAPPPGTLPGSNGGGTAASGGSLALSGAASGRGPDAFIAGSSQQSVGLALSAPPLVEQLTPLAGISFGQAPYLWPLFLLLDVIAAVALVAVVRKTWSATPDAD